MHSATCSIWSREMKQKVSDETGAIQVVANLLCLFRFSHLFYPKIQGEIAYAVDVLTEAISTYPIRSAE